jgi:hypothetical protein
MSRTRDITGQRFGRLVAIERLGRIEGITLWQFACDCGAYPIRRLQSVVAGLTKSCGCIVKEGSHRTHGKSKTNSEYSVWCAMKSRCHRKTSSNYHRYGAKGIKVCDRWLNDFESFLKDMGPRPSLKHSIDRIDSMGNYEPGNCRWATAKEQALNTTRAKTYLNGEKITHEELAKICSVTRTAITFHLKKNKTVEEILKHYNVEVMDVAC